jgi:serine/threonine-protein kinase
VENSKNTSDPTLVEEDATHFDSPGASRRSQSQSVDLSEGTIDDTRDIGTGPGAGSRPGSSELGISHLSSTHWTIAPSSPVEALRLEEMERTRLFCFIVYALAIAVPAAFLFIGGSTFMKYVVCGMIVVVTAAAGWLHTQLRDPDRDLTNAITVVAMIAAFTAFSGVVMWGVFSVAPAIMVMGIYFFSRSESQLAAILVAATCAGLQAIFSTLMMLEIIPDPGLFQRTGSIQDQIITQVLVQGIYLASFFIARSTRTTTLNTISKLQAAMHQLSNREVLLQEVKQELDRALRVEGAGRYTDHNLGKWNLKSVLGRGAMGEVYEAFHQETDQKAAIKVLHPNVMQSPDHVTRFFREAKAAGALRSKHVVQILEVSDTMDVVPYIAMEKLNGSDLSHHLRNRRKFALGEVHKLVREVGIVLDLARKQGIVHRDIKPQNMLLSEQSDGHSIWKVLDFGVSKLGESSGTLTQGHVIGTPAYMAPEQARGEEVDPSADLYALGAVAYRCLTGRPPYSGKEVAVIIFKVVCEMPTRPTLLADVHEDVDFVLAVALAKDRSKRFRSASDLSTALKRAAKGELDAGTRLLAKDLLEEQPWSEQV